MGAGKRAYVFEAVVAGAVLPLAVLLIPLSVWLHFYYCEWEVFSNWNGARLPDQSRLLLFVHARETCDIDRAFRFGLLLPVAMLIGGTWTALIAGDYLFCYSVRSSLKMDARTRQLFFTPPQRRFRRFQFSLLALVVLTAFVAIVLKFALAFPPR